MTAEPPRVRPHLAQLPGYAPVVPLAERARLAGLNPEDCLKLDANENPYGMHPLVREALQSALRDPTFGSIYPDPNQTELRSALSRYTGLDPSMIIAGAGADELLDLALRALMPPGAALITCPPSFGMYPFLADVNQLNLVDIPRIGDFTLRQESLLEAVDAAEDNAIVVLTSPNNPSGDLVPRPLLRELLAAGATVMLDEAYIEFAGRDASAQDLLSDFPRLIIMRTFSKWAGIAGLRLGYALAHPDLVADLIKVKQPYNINQAAESAGMAAIASADEIGRQIDSIRRTRSRLDGVLREIDGLDPLPSESNFILIEVNPAVGTGRELHDRLASVGVFTRTYSDPLLTNYLRISIPRADQLDILLERLSSVL
ncbi:MAG: aminotransferase class I/II-fold pyridoxal phosphate-dependent enzyme [Chloroflexi bacterium]|nr:aminotransferase class I/II-fold pyridoxal phosphate-dependent enzyme [Chloroflexota bacterium]MYF81101.1 aminotransferase class I/II-fold pyridoxal phosphate-dependent enzyme [Chloroflexota bacterium]MYI03769.1 aminotransferase class I/II-fold pyridoxal phosphate-dependent enzyme [Chloroflexota bacterium]